MKRFIILLALVSACTGETTAPAPCQIDQRFVVPVDTMGMHGTVTVSVDGHVTGCH